MRIPASLASLIEMGLIDRVLRPLMSGKEAQLFLIISGGEQRVAKVYKEASQRSFKSRADYTEGRKVRNSRDRRAMHKRSRYGREQDEAAWRSAEVDVIYRLRDAGVTVPTPYSFSEGVLIMELICDEEGLPAPRLGDLSLGPDEARRVYTHVLQDVVRMLCAGIVHGDLSDLNILMGANGPVIIDFPQAVDPAHNSNARRLLLRDVDNLHSFLSGVVRHPRLPYGPEIWDLYERNELQPQTQLRGQYRDNRRQANTKDVLAHINESEREHARYGSQTRRGGRGGRDNGGTQDRPRHQGARNGGNNERPPQGTKPTVEVRVRSSDGRTRSLHPPEPSPERPQTHSPDSRVSNNHPEGESSPTPPKRRRRRRRSPRPRQDEPQAEPQAGEAQEKPSPGNAGAKPDAARDRRKAPSPQS